MSMLWTCWLKICTGILGRLYLQVLGVSPSKELPNDTKEYGGYFLSPFYVDCEDVSLMFAWFPLMV